MQDGKIDWRRPNRMSVIVAVLAAVALHFLPDSNLPYPWSILLVVVTISFAVFVLATAYGVEIRMFAPASVHEAKRANEQIKTLAGMLNTVAAGGTVAFALSNFRDANPDYGVVALAVGFGLFVHNVARDTLGLIKNEDAEAYKGADKATGA